MAYVKQISVFLDNKPNQLTGVMKLLKNHSRKLSDYFKQYRILAIISAVLFVAIVASCQDSREGYCQYYV